MLNLSLVLLQQQITGCHVGGKTALDGYGALHYALLRPTLRLFDGATTRVPNWFGRHFQSRHRRKRLFTEKPVQTPGVGRCKNRESAPLISTPERAVHPSEPPVGDIEVQGWVADAQTMNQVCLDTARLMIQVVPREGRDIE